MKLHNDVVEGIFSFKRLASGRTVMTFDAISLKRFAMIFAFWHKGSWRIRFRLVVTTNNGMIVFPLTKTVYMNNGQPQVPEDYKVNTTLFFALHSEADVNKIAMRIFANATGNISSGQFNGYESAVEWSKVTDTLSTPDELKSNYARSRKFSSHLYHANGEHRVVGSVINQRMVPAPTVPVLNPLDDVCDSSDFIVLSIFFHFYSIFLGELGLKLC